MVQCAIIRTVCVQIIDILDFASDNKPPIDSLSGRLCILYERTDGIYISLANIIDNHGIN